MKRKFSLVFLPVLLVIMGYLYISIGSSEGRIIFNFDWPFLIGDDQETEWIIISRLRFPRMLAAIIAGAALALSGMLLQTVTRNPLADPFLLGVSGGASLAIVVVSATPVVFHFARWWVLPVVAFLGAQAATFFVLFMARGVSMKISSLTLVLSGVIINAFCAAITTFLLMQFEPVRMKVTSLWLAGAIGHFEPSELFIVSVVIIFSLILIRIKAVYLNAFALGEEGAFIVGVNTNKMLTWSTWMASLLAGMAVAIAGMVGYVGLLVPHLVRMVQGNDLKKNIIPVAILGALLLLLGDLAARTILAPREIPVGILAALIGTPFLLVLLRKEMRL